MKRKILNVVYFLYFLYLIYVLYAIFIVKIPASLRNTLIYIAAGIGIIILLIEIFS